MSFIHEISIRPARLDDLDAITAFGPASLPADPAWSHRYSCADQFPGGHYKHLRARYAEYLANVEGSAYAVMLAEAPSSKDRNIMEVLGMSMWQLPGTYRKEFNDLKKAQKDMKPRADYIDRHDVDPGRMKAFRESIQQCQRVTFNGVYGEKQLNLMVLVTAAGYQKRVAKALVEWGKQKARDEGLAVTLFSSPQGLAFYKSLGFEEVGVCHCQVIGETEFLEFPMLVFRSL